MVLEKIVESFWKLNLIRFPQDIFKLDFKKIEKLEVGKVISWKFEIFYKRKNFFDRFIYALGIRHIGLENAKLLSKYFGTFSSFYDLSKNNNLDLLNIDGIGETQVNNQKLFFK